MSSLTGADKRLFEEVFGMGKGKVLNFTKPSFERFFIDYGIDILGDKYDFHGPSKAKRLRAFWDIEPDEHVGRVLLGLLESSVVLEHDSAEFRKCHAIAAILSGMSLEGIGRNVLQGRNEETEKVSEDRQLEKLWGPGPIRVFISHTNQFKNDAMSIKNALKVFGIASFVAHSDIEPSEEWQKEIVCALSSMNLFIALLTEGFNESYWTDQEVGFALARKVPILPVSREVLPYGFIEKIQALKWSRSSAEPVASKIMEMALKKDKLKSYAKSAFIEAMAGSGCWAETNKLSRILPYIESLTSDEADRLVNVYNSNSQVYEEWRIQDYILDELGRMTGNTYMFDNFRRLQKDEQPENIPL